jgi:hypothetical protein
MLRYFSITFALLSLTVGATLRAANAPHAVRGLEAQHTWTNEDLQQLSRNPGLISIVGQRENESSRRVVSSKPRLPADDRAWYAARSTELNARLESEEADLRDFTQLLEGARERKNTIPGLNLEEADVGVTPEATIDILQERVNGTQAEIEALEDLARRNGIEPGVLRGQWDGAPTDIADTAED